METVRRNLTTLDTISKGSDKALRFLHRTLNQLSKQTLLIEKSFTQGITLDERLLIINALEEQKIFTNQQHINSVPMVQRIIYDHINNKITIIANPEYHVRLRESIYTEISSRVKK